MLTKTRIVASAIALSAASPALAQTEIQWWHAMTGGNNDVVVKLAEEFNQSQKDYKVVPVYKGSYPDTMNAGIAAFRAGNAPHIMQVFEVGTATMMAAKGAVKPVLPAHAGGRREVRSAGLSVGDHRLLLDGQGRDAVLPVQLVLDRDVVQQGRLQEGGARSGQAAEDLARGVRGGEEAEGRRPRHLRLLERLGDLGQPRAALGLAQRAAGDEGERPRRLRHRAEVQRSAAGQAPAEPRRPAEGQDLRLFRPHQHRRGPLHLGRMPDHADLLGVLRQHPGERQVRVRRGADAVSIPMFRARRRTRSSAAPRYGSWAARSPRNTRASPSSSRSCPTPTGRSRCTRRPAISRSPRRPTRRRRNRASTPDAPYLETPLLELTNKEPTENSRGLRLGNMVQLRDIWAEEIEGALAGQKSAQAALDAAVARGNAMLRQFERTVTR